MQESLDDSQAQKLINCDRGWRGDCCCNCKNLLKIVKHPWNKGEAKGSINETYGYGCAVFSMSTVNVDLLHQSVENPNETSRSIVFFENSHGFCEMHSPTREREDYLKTQRTAKKFGI